MRHLLENLILYLYPVSPALVLVVVLIAAILLTQAALLISSSIHTRRQLRSARPTVKPDSRLENKLRSAQRQVETLTRNRY